MQFALVCKETGIPASKRLGLTGADGFAIDHAVMVRLRALKRDDYKVLAYEIAKATWGGGDESGTSDVGAEVW